MLSFDQAIEKIALELHPEQILLFGSRAREDARLDSDYDLLVVVDGNINPHQLAAQAHLAARPRQFALDIVVVSSLELEQGVHEKTDFIFEAVKQSKVLYAKTNQSVVVAG
jgi:uncharacterized protein